MVERSRLAPAGVLRWNDLVAAKIGSWRPGRCPEQVWELLAPTVRQIATVAGPRSPEHAKQVLATAYRLARFAYEQGFPVTVSSVLAPEAIAAFVQVGCGKVAESTRAARQREAWQLRQAVVGLQDASGGTAPPVRFNAYDPNAPYSRTEMTLLWSWAGGQPTEALRRGCRQLIVLGAGCGLTSAEVIQVRGHDVRLGGQVGDPVSVRARATRDRGVLCRRDWERALRQEAEPLAGQVVYLFQPRCHVRTAGVVSGFLARAHPAPGPPKLSMPRLRSTWLVGLLNDNVPLTTIVAVGADDVWATLQRVIRYARALEPDQAARALRGAP
ncbi:hypothetical protein [Actinomadura rupiterrae]|uniref:hypothetical protein n=1 Tax=Actinomadura rupiterrae TaxID=559627 RepID=UPI0020A55A63|nr:hypothetical protein [Actinomadura rupiterrae]MCP2340674.1 hypothetical protein [Actinomadura rupiterrae]